MNEKLEGKTKAKNIKKKKKTMKKLLKNIRTEK